MEIKILIVGIKCYNEKELKELISLLKDDFKLKKLPSSDEYLLCCVPDNEVKDISEEMHEISKGHSNPAWEIITRQINSQTDLEELPIALYFEANY